MKKMEFYKISAAGNDFVLVDNRKKIFSRNAPQLVKKLCQIKFSVGADGLILLEQSKSCDFKMIYYNADGSRAEMCGNGGRSIARFANILGIVGKKMVFETDSGNIHAEILGKTVRLGLIEPKDTKLDIMLRVDKKEFDVSFIDTGVPHTVVLVNNIERADVAGLGRMIRNHKQFAPKGTNVNFVQRKDSNTILVRTYERGVEDETLACGTGVTASAIISGLKDIVKPPVDCLTRGGDTLAVSYTINDSSDFISPVSNVTLEGPAEVSFTGEVLI